MFFLFFLGGGDTPLRNSVRNSAARMVAGLGRAGPGTTAPTSIARLGPLAYRRDDGRDGHCEAKTQEHKGWKMKIK